MRGPKDKPGEIYMDATGQGKEMSQGQFCQRCNAWRGCLGLEPTPELYVKHMVEVFREVRRVLRDDGTLWLNLGDSYAGNSSAGDKVFGNPEFNANRPSRAETKTAAKIVPPGLKPKDLVGIPWRVAFALQADGWWLRSDIIWHKPNPMPESVTDRPTKSHEYVFLLTKSARYYYDAEAVSEKVDPKWENSHYKYYRGKGTASHKDQQPYHQDDGRFADTGGRFAPTRNRRSVWTIATKPYRGAHFATYPPALVEPCILAGTSARGACSECGAPWKRVVEKPKPPAEVYTGTVKPDSIAPVSHPELGRVGMGQKLQNWLNAHPAITTGWRPTCDCGREDVTPCLVLDPFCGSGTTGMVAIKHGREFVGLDLSGEYLSTLAIERLNKIQRVLL